MPEVKSEGAYEENDTVIIEKMDGGSTLLVTLSWKPDTCIFQTPTGH